MGIFVLLMSYIQYHICVILIYETKKLKLWLLLLLFNTYSNNTEMIYENSTNKWTLCNDWLFLFTAGRCILFLSDGWDHGTDDSDDLFGFLDK